VLAAQSLAVDAAAASLDRAPVAAAFDEVVAAAEAAGEDFAVAAFVEAECSRSALSLVVRAAEAPAVRRCLATLFPYRA